MATHEFILILSGVSELTPELADTLYKATDGDIELNMRDGIAWLACCRQADSMRDAVFSLIQAVEGAEAGVRVLRVLGFAKQDTKIIDEMNNEISAGLDSVIQPWLLTRC